MENEFNVNGTRKEEKEKELVIEDYMQKAINQEVKKSIKKLETQYNRIINSMFGKGKNPNPKTWIPIPPYEELIKLDGFELDGDFIRIINK